MLGSQESARNPHISETPRNFENLESEKVDQFPIKGTPTDEVIGAMLGPTGNLRAPTMRVGKTIVVGFNEEQYQTVLKL